MRPPGQPRPVDTVNTKDTPESDVGWLSRQRLLTLVLGLATLLSLYLCYRIVMPFVPAIALAAALAVATDRPFRALKRRVKGDTAAAGISVVLVTLLILAPVLLLGYQILQQGMDAFHELGGSNLDLRSLLSRQPQLAAAVGWVEERLDLQGQIARIGQASAGWAGRILSQSVNVITQLVLALFVLFFLYRDRRPALQTVCSMLPLSRSEADLLFTRVANTIRATVNGSITVAAVQAVLAGIMYTILSVPAPLLWGAATGVAALVPVFGTVLVWGPACLYLLITGSWVKAIIMGAWGLFAVGTIDNFLYPVLVGEKLRIHTVPTLFAVLGGIALFGPVGLILGPLALAVTIALVDIWKSRTAMGHSAEEAVAEPVRTSPRIVPPRSLAG